MCAVRIYPHLTSKTGETKISLINVSKVPLASFLLFIGPESNYCLVLSQLLHGFVKVVLYISCSLPNKTKVKFDQGSKVVEASVLN